MAGDTLAEFRIKVRPSPGSNDHEVCLLADGTNLIEQFEKGMMGLDPADLLTETCALRPSSLPHVALIARCGCGVIGCGRIEVTIHKDGERVIWTAIDSSRNIQFDAAQYEAEIERAIHDHSWETPERTSGRLIFLSVDRASLARRGFEFSWASGRCFEGMMTVSLMLTPGPYQVLVRQPWDGKDIDGIVSKFKKILSQPPETWPNVQWNPQVKGLGPPPFADSGSE